MPAKIQEVTTSQKLIKKFALVGQISPQLDETIVPVVVLDDLSDSEEWRWGFLEDTRAGGGVGTFNTWSLDNPAGSGSLVQLLTVAFSSPDAQMWVVHLNGGTAILGLALAPEFQDLRGPFTPPLVPRRIPIGTPHWEALGAALGLLHVSNIPLGAGVMGHWTAEQLLIYPGTRIYFQPQTANTEARCEWTWRERALRTDGS